MDTLTANFSGKPRRAMLNGREHIVVPMSLIVNGVLPGSEGPLFYPADEIAKDVEQWNGMPLVKDHPFENGKACSARRADILNSQGIGTVLNARYVRATSKLKAEGWFDVENTKRVDQTILDSLLQGKPIELSTGLFTDKVNAKPNATFNGKSYSRIALNYKPDHVAILTDKVGACSIKEGCGVLINEKTEDTELTYNRNWPQSKRNKTPTQDFAGPDESFPIADQADVDAASHLIGKAADPDAVKAKIRRIAKRKGLKVPESWDKPTQNEDDESDSDDTDVTDNSKHEGEQMKLKPKQREDLITKLITNCSCEGKQGEFSEEDRSVLNELSDDALQAIGTKQEVTANAGTTAVDVKKKKAPPKMVEEETDDDKDADNKNAQGVTTPTKNERTPVAEEKKVITDNEWFEQAPPGIRAAVQNAVRIETREKQLIVNRLTAHMVDGDPKTAAIAKLMSKPIDDLMERESMMPKPAPTANNEGTGTSTLPLYFTSAVAAPVVNATNKERESDYALPMTINYNDLASERMVKRLHHN